MTSIGLGPLPANPTGLRFRATQDLAATTALVTFTGIPATLRTARVSYSARTTTAAYAEVMMMRINNDSGSVYAYTWQVMQNVTTTGLANTAGFTGGVAGLLAGANDTATQFGVGEIVFPSWDSTNRLSWLWQGYVYGETPTNTMLDHGGGIYSPAVPGNNTAITLYPLSGSFTAGSRFTVTGEV